MLCIDGLPALGSTIDLSSIQNPDLSALALTASYTPSAGSTGTFTITGYPTSFKVANGNGPYGIAGNSVYDLTALINKNTGQLISGSLLIGGTISSASVPNASSGTLLTATLTNFGFSNSGGDFFQFVANITGGDLAHYYSSTMGIQVDASDSEFAGSFLTSFSTDVFATTSDNASFNVVPEPSAVFLMLTSLLCALSLSIRRLRWRAKLLYSLG